MEALQILKDARQIIEDYDAFNARLYNRDVIGAVRSAAGYRASMGIDTFLTRSYHNEDPHLKDALAALDRVAITRGCTAVPFRGEERTWWIGASTDWYGMYGSDEPTGPEMDPTQLADHDKEWALGFVDEAIVQLTQ